MTVALSLFAGAGAQFLDNSGKVLTGGLLYTYAAGTTTPLTTYTSSSGSTPNSNPIVLDSAGRLSSGEIWLTPATSYKFVLKTSTGVTLQTLDNISSAVDTNSLSASNGSSLMGFLQAGSGAVAETVQEKLRLTVSVWDFMTAAMKADVLAGTLLVDTLPAFQAAMDSFVTTFDTTYYSMGGTVIAPPGKYYWASTFIIDRNIKLAGVGSPFGNDEGISQIFVANNNDGILVADYRNSPNNKQGTGATIENIAIFPKTSGGTVGSGVSLKSTARLINVFVVGWPEHGVKIDASTAYVPKSNANVWYMSGCTTSSNGKSGLFVEGADANAGTCISHNAIGNGEWGIYDSSFLGNTYVGCHTAQNTLGAYKSDGVSARNIFIGCYSESDQPTSVIALPSMVIGGLHAAGVTGPLLDGGTTEIRSSYPLHAPTFWLGYGQPLTSGSGIQFDDTDGTYSWTFEKAVGRWGYKWANLGTPGFINFYDRTATVANGYARDLSGSNGAIGIGAYYFGTPSQMKARQLGSAAPTTGTWLQGDIVENIAPTSGGYIGWVCTAGGTPGTWKTFGLIS